VFVMTLRYSRHSFRRIVWKSSQQVWAQLHEEPSTLEALLKHDIIFYGRTNGEASPLILDGSKGSSRLRPEARLIVGKAEAQVDAVVRGFGIAQLSTWLIADQMKSGSLVEILPTLATAGLPLHLLWPRGRQLLPKVDALISHLGASLTV
jgi:DNA-binding transcriptional LysR family regulator